MKSLFAFMLLLVTVISCKKKESESDAATTGKVTFYMAPSSGTWDLIVDGNDIGLINETTQAPVCEDVDFITLELSIGTHTADLKSNDGYAWGNPKSFTVSEGCKSYKVTH